MQHRATWWPNECNMLDSTMLNDVASTCWIRLAGPLEEIKFLLDIYLCTQLDSEFQIVESLGYPSLE